MDTARDFETEQMQTTSAPEADAAPFSADDPVFAAEREHLSDTWDTLKGMHDALAREIARVEAEAAEDKKNMADEVTHNFASIEEAQETYVEYSSVNRVIDGYNIEQGALERKFSDVSLLLNQPYFAKIALQFKPGAEPKELYIGVVGISDDSYRRMVVDWRSPVAEVYYNQDSGATSYVANGRTINVDLKLRRQFDITRSTLNAYFDTTVAIQDELLLASLSKQRSAHMRDITATIQKEQNVVIRHEDVPALLVSGIAGSGKTSVLLQRIAYLLYQRRDDLDPRDVFLITPNPVFRSYISNVLPGMGERNPDILTWDDFARFMLPEGRGHGGEIVPLDTLRRIDAGIAGLELEPADFRDVKVDGTVLVSANQIRQISARYERIPAGPHRLTLMREKIMGRLEARIAQLASREDMQNEVYALSIEEQLRIFGELAEPQNEQEERDFALRYLKDRFAAAYTMVERDEWLRIDRIGVRLLGGDGIESVTWMYLKVALTGCGNGRARYVMIDEVQNYTEAQIAVLARYFRRAHLLLLGDENQAIKPGTASFAQVRALLEELRGSVETCSLMTSYRSTPAITELFARLARSEDALRISSVRREQDAPIIAAYEDDAAYAQALRDAVAAARATDGLAAVIAPWKREAKRVAELLGDDAPQLVDDRTLMPESGIVLMTLDQAQGLEFDYVVVPDASARLFPADDEVARHRLYTTISRATRHIAILAYGKLTTLLDGANAEA